MSEETEQDLGRAVDALGREVRNLRDLVLAYNPRIRELEDRLDATERQLSALGTRMDSAEARPDPLEDRIDHAERSEDALGVRITALETKSLATEEWTEEVRRGLEGGQDAMNGLRADLDDLRKGLADE
jgi:predicted  nucleic acid-binding Zn-ribbon protein